MNSRTDYTRNGGRRLTYSIDAGDSGAYTVLLGERVLLRGWDPLAADGRFRKPNKRKLAGALHEAKLQIESLSLMSEI